MNSDLNVWPVRGDVEHLHVGRHKDGQLAEDELPEEAEWLLAGVPRELADVLRDTGQWVTLRCRPWLSAGAFRGLQRNMQRCQLRQLAERYREAETLEECSYSQPQHVPWGELDLDHVVSAGQVFKLQDVPKDKSAHLRRIGFQALRQGKVAVALLAGGTNLRLGIGEPPVGCSRMLQLCSNKSILQLCCERIRRMASLCTSVSDKRGMPPPVGNNEPRPGRASIPVFVMTSRLTHRCVVEHFEANHYFGLPPRDVLFFEQPVLPVLDNADRLLPQSLGGEFAYAPGGTGQALRALAGSSALEQMRDRGVECLHILGTENLLARVCDPVFIGFCRDLDIDCACKVVDRLDVKEDLELFCVRQSPVSTQFADIEDAACGVDPTEAPNEVLNLRSCTGTLTYGGSINSVYMSVSYAEEVVGRPVRARRLARAMPFLDFHLEPEPLVVTERVIPARTPRSEAENGTRDHAAPERHRHQPAPGVPVGCWPAESTSPELSCQRALLTAAAEVRSQSFAGPEGSPEDMCWRCDVHLDCDGPVAVVRVKSAKAGPSRLPRSLLGPHGVEAAVAAHAAAMPLRCSLVVPTKPNAWVLETSILDYFAYTDRAVALQVPRQLEFAPVRESKGRHSVDAARKAMHLLHSSWITVAGGKFAIPTNSDPNAIVEVSPLLSYEGEGLGSTGICDADPLKLPLHLPGPNEVPVGTSQDADAAAVPDEATDGLDTRPYYLQEYPRRLEVSCSHVPRFLSSGGPNCNSNNVPCDFSRDWKATWPPTPSRCEVADDLEGRYSPPI